MSARLLTDLYRAYIEWLGLGVAAGIAVETGEVVEPDGKVGVLGAEHLLVDGDGTQEEELGLGPDGSGLT